MKDREIGKGHKCRGRCPRGAVEAFGTGLLRGIRGEFQRSSISPDTSRRKRRYRGKTWSRRQRASRSAWERAGRWVRA